MTKKLHFYIGKPWKTQQRLCVLYSTAAYETGNKVTNQWTSVFTILNTWFRASWFNVNTGPTRCNSMQTFIHIRIKTRWKEVTVPLPWHTQEVADTVFSTPDDGCVTPQTCRVTWQWINVCILLQRVGPLLTLFLPFYLWHFFSSGDRR